MQNTQIITADKCYTFNPFLKVLLSNGRFTEHYDD